MKYFIYILSAMISIALVNAKAVELEVVTESWPPFIIPDEEVSGVVTKRIREILKYADIDYAINIYPWNRAYHLAKTKPNILIYSIYKTKEREAYFHWFCPVYQSTPIRFYKLTSNQTNIDSIDAIKSSILGVMRGDNSHEYLLSLGFKSGVNLDVSSNENANLRKLIKGRVDVVIQSEESIKYRLNQLGADDSKITAGMLLHQEQKAEHCMALGIETKPELIEKVKKGFQKWQKNKSL